MQSIYFPSTNSRIRLTAFVCILCAPFANVRATTIEAQSALVGVIDEIEVPARTAGVLATVKVTEGNSVQGGDTIATIDDREPRLVYERAAQEHELARQKAANDVSIRSSETALQFARDEYDRLKRAADQRAGSISRSELEEFRVKSEQAAFELEQAKQDHQMDALTLQVKQKDREMALLRVKLCEIESPVQGMIVEVLRRQGEWVEPGESVMRIVRTDRLQVDGLVDARFGLAELKDAPVTISTESQNEKSATAQGKIVFLNPEINPVSGQLRVRAEFENSAGEFLPGMRVRMTITPRAATARQSTVDSAPAITGSRGGR